MNLYKTIKSKIYAEYYRWQWLCAWKSVVARGYPDKRIRMTYARSFNSRRYWWQKELPVE
jgi:hypothetical protein